MASISYDALAEPERHLRIIAGAIDNAGAITEGQGFQVTVTAAGNYLITLEDDLLPGAGAGETGQIIAAIATSKAANLAGIQEDTAEIGEVTLAAGANSLRLLNYDHVGGAIAAPGDGIYFVLFVTPSASY